VKERTSPRCLFAGTLTRDYAILSSGKALLDIPGGNLLFSAAGFAIWEPEATPGLLARVGEDYPQDWIESFQQNRMDIDGIRVLPEAMDVRNFYVYTDITTIKKEDPVAHFARLEIPFPKALLGFRPTAPRPNDSRSHLTPISLRQADIPSSYLDAAAAHLCPIDYMTHSLLPAVLRQAGLTTVTLDPGSAYMNAIFWNDVPSLITGLTAFIPSEEEMRALFQGRISDLWQMAEVVSSWGCEFVIIKRGLNGQYLYDSITKARWDIPAYPARVTDITGAGDAFCGGFLAGYLKTYDPMMGALYGGVSASLAVEGQGPFYSLHALPGLAQARLMALKDNVRRM
jgi:hypothetical protein